MRTSPLSAVHAVCFDLGGTLMSEAGPEDIPMALWPQVVVLPGAAECLAALAGRVPIAIATNASVSSRPMIEHALSRAGLLPHVGEVFCFTELGVRKSQHEFWQAVSERLGVPHVRIAMVGDSYEQDAAMPRRFGIQGVWLNPAKAPQGALGPVPEVSDLIEFAGWVRAAC